MGHFYKLMQRELFLQSCACKAFEHFYDLLVGRRRHRVGRNYSGRNMGWVEGVEGGGVGGEGGRRAPTRG